MADEWRRMYPTHTSKHVAQAVGCTVDAAENLLKGSFSSASMGKIIIAYGPGWVAERVLETAGLNLESYLEQQVADAERAARKAREKAHEAKRRLERLQAIRSDSADLDRQAADRPE